MKITLKHVARWGILSIAIFSIFRWLFGYAVPAAAFEFAIGITFILLSGLFSGKYISQVLLKNDIQRQNTLLSSLVGAIFIGFMLLGWLLNTMIKETEFVNFFSTVVLIFLISGFTGAVIGLLRNRSVENVPSTIKPREFDAQPAVEKTHNNQNLKPGSLTDLIQNPSHI